jgi:hypothetical protein
MLTTRLFSGLALVTALAIGCSSDPTGVIIKDLNGSWTELNEGPPAGGEQWTLSTQGTAVTGSGTWSAEAGGAGTLTVSGYVRGDSVHLVAIHVVDPKLYPPQGPFVSQFNGVLASPTMLVGFATPQADDVRFKKD